MNGYQDNKVIKTNPDPRIKNLLERLPQLASKFDDRELINEICRQVKKLLPADYALVMQLNWAEKRLDILATSEKEGRENYPKEFSLKIGEGISGRVYSNKKSEIVPNVQENKDFITYVQKLKGINKERKYDEYISHLKSFEHIITVPLKLDQKVIGVLHAIRKKSSESNSFNESDKQLVELFASLVVTAILNTWLWEAITWQPTEKRSIKQLCDEVVKEATKRTVADDGQLRFRSWNAVHLVPGKVKVSDNAVLGVCELCEQQHSKCALCRAVNDGKTVLANDLENDNDFQSFKKSVISRKDLIQKMLTSLQQCQNLIKNRDGNSMRNVFKQQLDNLNKIFTDNISINNIKKRFDLDILRDEPLNIKKVSDLTEAQIYSLELSIEGWNEYISYIDKIKSELVVPIFHGSDVLGVLAVHSYNPKWFTESDKAIMISLANRIADKVTERQQSIIKNLLDTGHKMSTHWTYSEVGEMLAKGVEECVTCSDKKTRIYSLLYMCKIPDTPKQKLKSKNFKENFEYKPRHSAKKEEKEMGKTQIRNNGLGYKAIEEFNKIEEKNKKLKKGEEIEKYVFVVRENVDDPISGGSDEARDKGVKTTACIPLTYEDIVYGLFYIHTKERHFFTKMEKDALILFATHAAIVLKNICYTGEDQTYKSFYGEELLNLASN